MKELTGIVISDYEPSETKLWLTEKGLKYYGSNGWESLLSQKENVMWGNIKDKPTFSNVTTTGSYNDLSNKPTPYSLPIATLTSLGGIKKATAVADVYMGADIIELVASVNALLTSLRAAGVLNI